MYSALIIDDEADARAVLSRLLELFCPEVETIEEARTASEALQLAASRSFDLAFIDIQLRHSNGLELANQLLRYCANLIFVTAHERYAVAAFQTEAIGYLLKPVDPDHLKKAIERADLSTSTPLEERILLHSKNGINVLIQAEIIRVQGDGNYCTFYCKGDRQYFISKNLSYYEGLLDPHRFYRVHQSHLINLAAVSACRKQAGQHYALMTNGDQVPVSRRRKEDFILTLERHIGR